MSYILSGGTPSSVGIAANTVDLGTLMDVLCTSLGNTQAYQWVFGQQPSFKPLVSAMSTAAVAVRGS